ncbi:DNA repair protein RecO [Alteribacter natronophilus]|uniref:DNA repair protein RecO n=1 Tax=Alteribacter natronophilus TaxID=2583810 RepID=UPI00110EB587|nr:DNA repair protein RecO [Alteribacter natronophilus]TMW74125.1 DNA repair protein RecO [Alteribacter natronophilus]
MLQKAEGIVIRTNDYGETNKIVTLFTREHGKLALMARGAKRPKSRFASSAQLFIYGIFIYRQSSGIGTLNQADITDSFRTVRSDLMLTSYGAYMVEITDRLMEDRQRNPFLFELLYQLLHRMNEGEDAEVLVRIFETKMLQTAGIAPMLDACVNCGRQDGSFAFSIREAGILCGQCFDIDPYRVAASPGTLKLLRLFHHLDVKRLGNISVKEETKKQLKNILHLYYDEYSGLRLKSRRFLEQMEKF